MSITNSSPDAGTRHGECLPDRIISWGSFDPGRPAVVAGAQVMTYGALDRRSEQVAQELFRLGVSRGDLVGVFMQRSTDLVAVLLGILRAGAVYVPLDPAQPDARLSSIASDAGLAWTLTQTGLVARAAGLSSSMRVVPVDEIRTDEVTGPQARITSRTRSHPGDLAYVMYTSGTTGRPKGVMVTHANVLALLDACYQIYDCTKSDVWSCFHSYAFDFSVFEIWGALCSGAKLVLISSEDARDPDRFLELLQTEKISILSQTPSAFRVLLGQLEAERHGSARFSWRHIVFGGEELNPSMLTAWFDRFGDDLPETRLTNMYGITETTVHVTRQRISSRQALESRISNIGTPIPGWGVHILNDDLASVDDGVEAEMFVTGAGVSAGYLNRPRLTAERFLPDPFSGVAGARMYRSGDTARRQSDGTLEYRGRVDRQVQVNGYRVELGEIEANLRTHPDLLDAFVSIHDLAPSGGTRIIAYVMASRMPSSEELRSFLRDLVPLYMIPTWFVPIAELPLTPNGKIDTAALPPPPRAEGGSPSVPSNPMEAKLLTIWRRVLGRPEIGVNDAFFDLGGDSITAMQIVAQARAEGIAVAASDVLEYPTIERLAGVSRPVQSRETNTSFVGEIGVTPIAAWFFENPWPRPDRWQQSVTLSVDGVKPEVLEQALSALVEHHEALRLRAPSRRPTDLYVVAHEPARLLQVYELPTTGEAVREREQQKIVDAVQLGLDLVNGPVLRAGLMRSQDATDLLIISVHHLAVDGVSWRILLDDLERCYADAEAGRPPAPASKTSSIREWAEVLARYAGDQGMKDLAYWQAVPTAAALPLDHPGGPREAGSAANVRVQMSAECTALLVNAAPRQLSATVEEVLLTALFRTMADWTGHTDITVDIEGHGRQSIDPDVDLTRTVGCFTSIAPLHVEVGDALLSRVRAALRGMPDRGLGYGVMRYLSDIEDRRPASDSPVLFNFLGRFPEGQRFRLVNEAIVLERHREGRLRYDLEINVGFEGDLLTVFWTYPPARLSGRKVQALADAFIEHLADVINPLTLPAVDDRIPLTPVQLGMLFESAMDPRNYLVQERYRIAGTVSASLLKRSLADLATEHVALRTTIVTDVTGDISARVLPEVDLEFNELDLTGRSPEDVSRAVADFLEADQEKGVDPWSSGPMVRFTLISDADGAELVFTFHHVLLDGWSTHLIFQKLPGHYEAVRAADQQDGHTPGEGRRPADDMAILRRFHGWLSSRKVGPTKEFWESQLDGDWHGGLVESAIRATEAGGGVDRQTLILGAELTGLVEGAGRRHGCTPAVVLHCAWALTLGRFLQRDDIVFGAVVSGRPPDLRDMTDAIGMFVNTLPLRVSMHPDRGLGEWMRETQRRIARLNGMSHSAITDIQGWLPGRDTSRLYDSMLVVETYPEVRRQSASINVELTQTIEQTGIPLAVVARRQPAGFEITFVRERQRLGDEVGSALAAGFQKSLADLVASPATARLSPMVGHVS